LNTSFFAENVALFAIIMGVALVLTGIGFGVMALGLLPARAPREAGAAESVMPPTAVAAG